MKKTKLFVSVLLVLIISLITYQMFNIETKTNSTISKNEKMISMYIVNEAGGQAVSETDSVPEGYEVDRYTCNKANSTTVSITVENDKLKMTSNGAASCKVYLIEPPIITCETVANSGNYVACDATNMYVGERVKIGHGANAQYFRYIRTRDTTSQLNECGTTSSTACADTSASTVGIPGVGYVRLLAEYNLNVGANIYSGGTTGLQHEYVRGYVESSIYPNSYNGGYFYGTMVYGNGNDAAYSSSNVKAYVEQYANTLSTTYGLSGLSGSAITKAEIFNLCGLSLYFGYCTNTYPWLYQTTYWSGSATSSVSACYVYSDGSVYDRDFDINYGYGVRPVIQIAASRL